MISSHSLTYRYLPGPELRFPDVSCPAGGHLLLLGPSGCGKTTLLHLLAGLLRPAGGRVEVAGTSLSALGTGPLDRFRGRHIGLVFQRPHLIASLTVQENLLLAQRLAGLRPDQGRVGELLHRLGLSPKAHRRPRQLSQGEQQRAIIARALLNRPQVLLADEPTSSLDDQNAQAVAALLAEQAAAEQAALLVVTHDRRLQDLFPNQIRL